MSKMTELSQQLLQLSTEIEKETADLRYRLSIADQELTDIYHYVEFSNLSAAAGYKAYKELQNCLKQRRQIKEDIAMADSCQDINNIASSVERRTALAKSRQYISRVRSDLFSNPKTVSVLSLKVTAIPCHDKGKSKKGQRVELTNLDDAVKLLVSSKGESFNFSADRIKKKILKAARTNQTYDGWNWILS